MQHVRANGSGVAALDVAGVSHAYGARKALADVSFAIRAASFTVLLGPNGAGKTTLFSLISRLFDTRQGAIRIFGHDVGRQSGEALRRLGIVFQARTLDLDLTRPPEPRLPCVSARHRQGGSAAAASPRCWTPSACPAACDDKARSLSGGQMRRIEIARALLHRPPLCCSTRRPSGSTWSPAPASWPPSAGWSKPTASACCWATHLIDEVDPGDDVVVLAEGRLAASGSVSEVLASTGTATVGAAFARLTGMDQAAGGGAP